MSLSDFKNTSDGSWTSGPWQHLKVVETTDAELSRGFLRCRPEKWFPGFAAHWLPLAHSLGLEVRVVEIKPMRRATKGLERGFYGVVDKERIAVYIDGESERVILSAISPGASRQANSIVLEYLARRFFSSLARAWSGAETTSVQFMREVETHAFTETAIVKFSLLINNSPCHISILLGESLVQRFDGLWRRQVKSSHRFAEESSNVKIELMQRAVSQSDLKELTKPEAQIPLFEDVPEHVTLLMGAKPWLPGRLCVVGEKLAVETIAAPLAVSSNADGAVKLRIEVGAMDLDAGLASEMTQVGSILETNLSLDGKVDIFANELKIAEGELMQSSGRMVVRVRG